MILSPKKKQYSLWIRVNILILNSAQVLNPYAVIL